MAVAVDRVGAMQAEVEDLTITRFQTNDVARYARALGRSTLLVERRIVILVWSFSRLRPFHGCICGRCPVPMLSVLSVDILDAA